MCRSLIHDILFFRIESAKTSIKEKVKLNTKNHQKVSFLKLIFVETFHK